MFLLLSGEGVVLCVSETIGHQSNGNILVNHGNLAYASGIVGAISEVDQLPGGIIPMKWCYKDGEFVPNPDWREPIPEGDANATIDELLTEMEAILNA